MIDRKLRYTLSAVAWVATLFWCLALLSSSLAATAAGPATPLTVSAELGVPQP